MSWRAANASADALRALVNGTVLAVDLAAARELVDAGAPVVATMAGDVIAGTRAWGGEVQAAAILARRAAYDDARTQADAAREYVAQAERALAQARAKAEEADEDFTQIAAQLGLATPPGSCHGTIGCAAPIAFRHLKSSATGRPAHRRGPGAALRRAGEPVRTTSQNRRRPRGSCATSSRVGRPAPKCPQIHCGRTLR